MLVTLTSLFIVNQAYVADESKSVEIISIAIAAASFLLADECLLLFFFIVILLFFRIVFVS